jgi:hypothetical protein
MNIQKIFIIGRCDGKWNGSVAVSGFEIVLMDIVSDQLIRAETI